MNSKFRGYFVESSGTYLGSLFPFLEILMPPWQRNVCGPLCQCLLSLLFESRHDANFVLKGGFEGCRNDKVDIMMIESCHHSNFIVTGVKTNSGVINDDKSWHCGSSRVSVTGHDNLPNRYQILRMFNASFKYWHTLELYKIFATIASKINTLWNQSWINSTYLT